MREKRSPRLLIGRFSMIETLSLVSKFSNKKSTFYSNKAVSMRYANLDRG